MEELERIIGQLIIVGLKANKLSRQIKKLISSGKVGGVILFPQTSSPAHLRSLIEKMAELSPEHPLFIAIDQEGGRVNRLKEPFTQFPPMRLLGRYGDEKISYQVGEALGRELRATGINLDFAPVLDLDLNPENQVIGDRSFGSEPELVARLGVGFIRGIQAQGIIACAKHFPGHGAGKEDSHQTLPRIDADKELIYSRELVPFKKAIESGVEMIMVGHLFFPSLDPYHPASLSEKIIQELLRKELNFSGLVIVDSLEMGALDFLPLEDRAFMALRAGADLVLTTEGEENVERIFQALMEAVKFGALSGERVYSSYQRVVEVKNKFLNNFLRSYRKDFKIIGCPEHKALVEKISPKSQFPKIS